MLAPNAAAVISNGLLCTDPTFARCKTIGTRNPTSPLYPKPLTGQDYLTGSLTRAGDHDPLPRPVPAHPGWPVTLATGTTTFTNLPDIPLTDLKVTLAGGPAAAFAATCNPAGGTATSALTTAERGSQRDRVGPVHGGQLPAGLRRLGRLGGGPGNGNGGSTHTGGGNRPGGRR